jgi:beta-N-acetylhexosaminidase
MNGATEYTHSLWLAVKEALRAGNDIVMMSLTPALDAPLWVRLTRAMAEEPAFRECVREAARRVVLLKLRYLRRPNAAPIIPDPNTVRNKSPDKDSIRFFQDNAARSVTIVRDDKGVFPLPASKAGRVFLAGQNLDFFRLGKIAYNNAPAWWYDPNKPDNIPSLLERVAGVDTIIVEMEDEEGVAVLNALRPLGKRLVVLSTLNPAYVEAVPWAGAVMAIYSTSEESFIAAYSAMTGAIPATGALPFKMNR